MNWTIHQTIMIQQLKVDSVANSSVLQIGTAGAISALSNQYNTSGSKEPEAGAQEIAATAARSVSLVPLPRPSRLE